MTILCRLTFHRLIISTIDTELFSLCCCRQFESKTSSGHHSQWICANWHNSQRSQFSHRVWQLSPSTSAPKHNTICLWFPLYVLLNLPRSIDYQTSSLFAKHTTQRRAQIDSFVHCCNRRLFRDDWNTFVLLRELKCDVINADDVKVFSSLLYVRWIFNEMLSTSFACAPLCVSLSILTLLLFFPIVSSCRTLFSLSFVVALYWCRKISTFILS